MKDSEHTKEVEFDPIDISSGFDVNDDSDRVADLGETTICCFIVVDVVVIGGMVVSSALVTAVSFIDRLAKHCVSCVKVRLDNCWTVMSRLEANSPRFVHDDVNWLSVMSSDGFVFLESGTVLLLVKGTDDNDAVDDIIVLKESSKAEAVVVVKSNLPDICGGGLKLSSN